jgi:hypothetical protein
MHAAMHAFMGGRAGMDEFGQIEPSGLLSQGVGVRNYL